VSELWILFPDHFKIFLWRDFGKVETFDIHFMAVYVIYIFITFKSFPLAMGADLDAADSDIGGV
jgi:hypothetical protein